MTGSRGEAASVSGDHRVELPQAGGWAIWRMVGLRGAGFPASRVLALAATPLCQVVDRFLEAEHALERERTLRAGRPRDSSETSESFRLASARVHDMAEQVRSAFRAAVTSTSETLREIATEPLFREAMIWQNRGAFELGVEWLLRQPITLSN